MAKPKLILLNGFAASGKTTLAKKYIDEHPLALLIEGDELVVSMGQWLAHNDQARALVYELTKSMIDVQLQSGHDVILPYLVLDSDHAAQFRSIADRHNADFYNIYLYSNRSVAIDRLRRRGTWGEAGADPVGDKDMPKINELYDAMEQALQRQADVKTIDPNGRPADQTYGLLKQLLLQSVRPPRAWSVGIEASPQR